MNHDKLMVLKPLKHLADKDNEGMKMLERIKREFFELVECRKWNVLSVSEICCCGPSKKKSDNLWGYNMTSSSAGRKVHRIYIRLRHARTHHLLDYPDIAGTMCHELAHCVHHAHSVKFYRLMEEIQQQHAIYLTRNVVLDNQGFPMNSSQTYVLGGPPISKQRNRTDLIRAAAENRAAKTKLYGSQHRLGSRSTNHPNPKEACRQAAENRRKNNSQALSAATCLPCNSADILRIWSETDDPALQLHDTSECVEILSSDDDDDDNEECDDQIRYTRTKEINNRNNDSTDTTMTNEDIVDLTSPDKRQQKRKNDSWNDSNNKSKQAMAVKIDSITDRKKHHEFDTLKIPTEEKLPKNNTSWNCQTCTFRNTHLSLECDMCRTIRRSLGTSCEKGKRHDTGTAGKHKWDCSRCTFINDETFSSCRVCGFIS